jgi:hypothetical protein
VTPDKVRALWPYLTDEERRELDELLAQDFAAVPWRSLPGPQTMARLSTADIVGYGGAAGGGKTDLVAGLAITEHERVLIVRREKAQTEGIVQRITEILGRTDGYSSQKGAWRIDHRLLEFAGLDNPGDERRWQGRPHDLKAFDEVTEMREQQVRFVMGWTRSNKPGQRTRVLMTFNPPTTNDGRWVIDFFAPWLDPKHPLYPTAPGAIRYAAMIPDGRGGSKDTWLDRGDEFILVNGKPFYDFDSSVQQPEDVITPKSRTFIPARLTDNPYYMATGYMSTLQSLPEPLRSQMLYGDFQAGIEDDAWQLIPTAWVDAAVARWKPRSPKGEMLNKGVDVARGGKDDTMFIGRHRDEQAGHSYWFDEPEVHPGTSTPNGSSVAGLVIASRTHDSPVVIDVIGVGASPFDMLNTLGVQIIGMNVSEAANSTDKSGMLRFSNMRSQLAWKLRELFDPANDTGVAIPPNSRLRKELTTPRWWPQGRVVHIETRDEIIKRLGWSPDMFTAVMFAAMDVPKVKVLQIASMREDVINYDPMAHMRGAMPDARGHDPFR